MSDSWNDYADGWDTNPAVIEYSEKAFSSLTEAVDLKGLRVLDFGCGTGLLSEKLAQQAESVVALDPAEKMIEVLASKQIANVETIASELNESVVESNPLVSQPFDLIVASSALAFVPDYQGTVTLLQQLLSPQGLLVQWDWLLEEGTEGSGFSPQQVTAAYEQAGLAVDSAGEAFQMTAGEDSMPVLLAVGRNE